MKPFIPVGLTFAFITLVALIQEYGYDKIYYTSESTEHFESAALKINDTSAATSVIVSSAEITPAKYFSNSAFSATNTSSEFSTTEFLASSFSAPNSSALDSSTSNSSESITNDTPSQFNPHHNRRARIINTDKSPILKALKNFWLEPLSDLPSSNIKRSGDLPIFERVHQQSDKQQSNQLSNQVWKRLYMRLKSCIESCSVKHACNHEDYQPSNPSNGDSNEENEKVLNSSLYNTSRADIVSSEESNQDMPGALKLDNPIEKSNISNDSSLTNLNLKRSDINARNLSSVNPVTEDNPFYKVFQNFWFQAIAPVEEEVTQQTLSKIPLEMSKASDFVENRVREEALIVDEKDDSCNNVALFLKQSNSRLRKCQHDYQDCIEKCMLQHNSVNVKS